MKSATSIRCTMKTSRQIQIEIGSAQSFWLQTARQPRILCVIGSYRLIVLFADSELWLALCAAWFRSIFYCNVAVVNRQQ